jgi:hypothetical protein
MENAEKSGEVVIADKRQIKESKRALFGFGSLKLPIFGIGDDKDAPTEIVAVIVALRDVGYGAWEFTLDNGMHWRQSDDEKIFPRQGQVVTIHTAAFGGYFLQVGKQRAIRAIRVQ